MIEFTIGRYAPRRVRATESDIYGILNPDNTIEKAKAVDVRVGQILHGHGRVEEIRPV